MHIWTRRSFLKRGSGLALATMGTRLWAETSKPPVVILQSAWDTINIGDIGHTPGTLRVLEQYLPQAKVILWASKLDDRVRQMLQKRFPKVEIVQGHPRRNDAAGRALKQLIQECDFFIRNSGMGQNIDFMEACREVGTPYGLYGQSYFENMVTGEGAEHRKQLLNAAQFIYCRDGKTLSILQKHQVRPAKLQFGPDGCFGIDVIDAERGQATLEKHQLEPGKYITIQLRTHTAKYPGVDGAPLNPLYPSPEMVADDERRAAVYRDLITRWVRTTGNKVLISPEVQKEMAHNKRFLYDPLPAEIQQKVVNLEHFWNADEAAYVFQHAHTVICHEPHSPIIALANGTPILHTYSEFHSPKCWMFQDIGLAEWLLEFDSTSAEQMFAALMKIDADYSAAKAKVQQAMDYVHECFRDSMQQLGEFLQQGDTTI